MTVAAPTHRLGDSRRLAPEARWVAAAALAAASGAFAFVLDALGVSAVLATAIGLAWLLFALAAFDAMRRIRAD